MSHLDGAQWIRSEIQQDVRASMPRRLDPVRDVMRYRHHCNLAERTDIDWIKRFILFHNEQIPECMTEQKQ